MSRYVISGYYGFGNAGDEAILRAIVSSLRGGDAAAEITVLSANPQQTAAEHDVIAISRTNLPQVFRALLRTDLFVSGGGGLLQDATSSRSLLYYLGLLTLARILGRRTMVYANSIGPIHQSRNRLLTRRVLQGVSHITVRDQLSLMALRDLGVSRPTMEVTADPVLLLPTPSLPVSDREVLFSVREWGSSNGYLQEVAKAAKQLKDSGFQVVFVPMHFSRDLSVSQRLASELEVDCISAPLSDQSMLQRLGSASVVVGMRLHSLIMATVSCRPMVGISYDPKVEGFLQAIGQPVAGDTRTLAADKLVSLVLSAYENRVSISEHLATQLDAQRQLANQNASIAIALAGGKQA